MAVTNVCGPATFKFVPRTTTMTDNTALFDRIPAEVWASIFIECLPSQHYIQPSASYSPILLCKVNRFWRSTAVSLSELWSSISVEVGKNSDIEKTVGGLTVWLGRSGVRPLVISLCVADGGYEVNLNPILDLLISFIGHWEDVRLELHDPLYGPISSIHLLRAPLLKRFEVHSRSEADPMIQPIFSMLSTSPRLTDFIWHTSHPSPLFAVTANFTECTLPWSQLTRLETDCLLVTRECLKVLHLCPNLIDCKFYVVARFPPPNFSIVHQHLRVLTLGGLSDLSREFLDRITLPALCTLDLTLDEYSECDWPQDSFVAFLSRSGCSLKTFNLHTGVVTSDQLVELLRLLPTLTALSIEGMASAALGDPLFHSLTYSPHDTVGGLCSCPELQLITLSGFIASSEGTLNKMLESRYHRDIPQSQVACLQRVTIKLKDRNDIWNKYLKELKTIRDTGLEVVVVQLFA